MTSEGSQAPVFGRLDELPVRTAWPHEARDLTPWLARNLDRLAEALEIGELRWEGTEEEVGRYCADVVARIAGTRDKVVIENQLEVADLNHLGQVIAYLAGLEAKVAIWIATDFNEDLLTAIRWQNEHTVDPFAFFAVRLRLVRVAGSPMVPIFEAVARPDRWERMVRRKESDLAHYRRSFWEHYRHRLPEAGIRAGHKDSNVYFRLESPAGNLEMSQHLAPSQGHVRLDVRKPTGAEEPDWDRLEPVREALRRRFPENAFDHSRDQKFGSHKLEVNARDPNEWNRIVDWFHNRHQEYKRLLAECVG